MCVYTSLPIDGPVCVDLLDAGRGMFLIISSSHYLIISSSSTLASLLIGLHKPTSGSMCLSSSLGGEGGGVEGWNDLSCCRIGVVEQSAALLNGTIGFNIGYGKVNNTTQHDFLLVVVRKEHHKVTSRKLRS